MVWGAFSSRGTLPLAFPSTRMDSKEYINVLERNLLPFLKQYEDEDWIFQQDNASIHSSKATKQWLTNKNIQVLDWPACSPDQNPIENLWGKLVKIVYANNRQFQSISSLKMAIQRAWQSLTLENDLNNLINSMPRRLHAIGEKKGGPTNY